MRINSSGNVGIGTTNPLSTLSVGSDGITDAAISGETAEVSGRGVYGYASNSGDVTNYGGYFQTDGRYGYGVYGYATGAGGRGVRGTALFSSGGTNYGGYFTAHASGGRGVYAYSDGSMGYGVIGSASGSEGYGIYGNATNSGDVTNYGGYFRANGSYGYAVYGWAASSSGTTNYGGRFAASSLHGYGIYATASGSSSYGIYAQSPNWAGYFWGDVNVTDSLHVEGNVDVTGTLSKGGGSFKIDHPLDPENKYLYHSFVESPDMMNIYNGNVVTNFNGEASVELPEWFEALNKDFRYQLTVIGEFAQAIVYEKIRNNHFSIKTDKPNIEVSWQVTGVRQDAFANANRIPVEEMKKDKKRGKYLHPAAFNMPKTAGVDYDERMEKERKAEEIRQAEESAKMEEEGVRMEAERNRIEKEENRIRDREK